MSSAAAPALPFPVVGIGASAGGIEALRAMFREMPESPGCAFVIVMHLSPDRPSLLVDILQRSTTLPVRIAENEPVSVNTIHVIPPNTMLGIAGGSLQVKPLGGRAERKPIDLFLADLAKDQGDYSAAVILSGSDGDGTLGAKVIKEYGGLTVAQISDGDPPLHPHMPRTAIASGVIDLALPVSEIGIRLKEFARNIGLLDGIATDGRHHDETRAFADARRELYALLRSRTGHDFAGYKEKTFVRRVQRRMQVNHIDDIETYVERLRQDAKEVTALFRDLLINVTNFFRDADAFDVLEKAVVPKLFAGRGADETVRIWVPGCATGEEVYSIAILVREHLDTLTAQPKVQIFATDIDEPALAVARAGRYPEALLENVSAARRARFFVSNGGAYALGKEVRDLCIFSPHSVIRDPPFSRLDLVSCRNLLIYFGADIQNQVIPTFHYALKPNGYLFLGTAENVSQFSDLFSPIDKKNRVFQSRGLPGAVARVPLMVSSMRPGKPGIDGGSGGQRQPSGTAFRLAIDSQILLAHAPAHVVVNRDGDVVHYSARTGKYLEAIPGAPSRQLVGMARKTLKLDLRATLRESMETESRVTRPGIVLETDEGRVQSVDLTVEPLDARINDERLFLVVFTDVGPVVSRAEMGQRAGAEDDVAHLERELRDTRERLQSLIEEYETALEELKSSNEELVSVNEELQSTNEELEASKEELQSLNEELHTVNSELNGKVDALDLANNDLQNLFDSTRVATIFLDRNLVIRSYTPAVSQLFNILPGDRGRPLTDLSGRISLPTLGEDVTQVLAGGHIAERSIDVGEGNSRINYLLRLVPYRDALNTTAGVVLTFVDVTSLTRAEAQQRVLIAELNHRVKNMLAIVIAIAEQTFRTTPDAAAFKERLVARVIAMAKSYELVSRDNWTLTPLEELAREHTTPFGMDRFELAGPKVMLTPREALSLGMVLHELATNAGKYGGLSVGNGRVALEWHQETGPTGRELVLFWREHGGPAVSEPEHKNFGIKLIEQETAYNLGGNATLEFKEPGLRATLRFPRREQTDAVF